MHSKADLLLFNARVLTMDPALPEAEAVAIGGNRIMARGRDSELAPLAGPGTRRIDCEKKTLLPAFHDAHMHLFALASNLISLDCSPAAVSSIVEIQQALSRRALSTPPGQWIKATGYNEFYLAEKRHPTRWDLDKAAPAHPVKLAHRTRQACVLNSRALALAGITAETPDPPGGLIERDPETGEPTGLLFGLNAHLSESVIPPPSDQELAEAITRAEKMLLASGITSIQDATSHNGPAQYERFRRAMTAGGFRLRVKIMLGIEGFQKLQRGEWSPADDSRGPSLGAVKIMIGEVSGRLNPPQPDLNEMVLSVHRAGFQVALHAIEANTVEAAITAIEGALRQWPREDHRHRIEHCAECPPPLLERLRTSRIAIVTQPAFLYFHGERYFATVEEHRLPWLYRIGSWQGAGLLTAASSDAPVIPHDPLIGIYAAVTRKAIIGRELLPEERIAPLEALRMHTAAGARAAFEEREKGTITAGKLADLVLLSADPTRVPPEEIKNIRVEKTILGGQIVWEA